RVELGRRVRPDRCEHVAVAGQRVAHHAAIADPGRVDAGSVGVDAPADLVDHRRDEPDVVDALAAGLTATAVDVPRTGDAIGIGHSELFGVRQLVPPVSSFGLFTVAE